MFLNGFLSRAYNRQQFRPTTLGLLMNPFYFARKGLFDHLHAVRSFAHGRVLDVGCGTQPYRSLFTVDDYVGLDIDTPMNRQAGLAEVFYDGGTFPFRDQEFDCVLTSQVLEHVFNPTLFLSEICRVLRVEGTLILTVPFVWDEHEQPVDFARYSSFGLRYLLENAGFRIILARKSIGDVRVIFQLANAYLYKVNPFGSPRWRLAFNIASAAPINIAGELLSRILPSNDDLYLDNCIVAERLT